MSRQDRHRQLCDAQVVPEHVLSLYDSQLGWKKMVRFNTKIKLSSTIQSNHKRALNLCLKQCFPCKLYHMYIYVKCKEGEKREGMGRLWWTQEHQNPNNTSYWLNVGYRFISKIITLLVLNRFRRDIFPPCHRSVKHFQVHSLIYHPFINLRIESLFIRFVCCFN